jgi:hypothetical protein
MKRDESTESALVRAGLAQSRIAELSLVGSAVTSPRPGKESGDRGVIADVKKIQTLVVLAVALGTVWVDSSTADAANSPTFRDCSLAAGLDPD